MKYACILFLLFPICVHAQLSGRIDSLGRKQGKFQEKMLFKDYPDSLSCIVRYQDGKRAADCDCFFENGAKAVTGYYRNNGIKEGNWTFLNPDGSINQRIWYDENGEVREKIYHTYTIDTAGGNKKQLQQTIYKDKYDNLVKTEYYEDKKLVKTTYASTGRTVKPPVGFVNLRGMWSVAAGYTYQNNHWLELGVKKHSYSEGVDDIDFSPKNYIGAGAEIGFDKNKKMEFAPKISAGVYCFAIFNINLNCTLYNDQFRKFYPAITPEAGISLPYGIIQIDYGYNLFLTPNTFMPRETHRLSLHINIPFFDTGYQ